ncbi:hypothetical protein CR513_35860, partial [Mucuna pruriens]
MFLHLCLLQRNELLLHASRNEAKQVMNLVLSDGRFWKLITFCLKCDSTYKSAKDIQNQSTHTYIKQWIKSKNKLLKNFKIKSQGIKKLWKFIGTRWNLQLHRSIHSISYYLNPSFERMIMNKRTKFIMDQQLEKFKVAKGLFGMNMEINTREKKQLCISLLFGGRVMVEKSKEEKGDTMILYACLILNQMMNESLKKRIIAYLYVLHGCTQEETSKVVKQKTMSEILKDRDVAILEVCNYIYVLYERVMMEKVEPIRQKSREEKEILMRKSNKK